MNKQASEILNEYAEKYSEYAEELGAGYAQFLLHIMAHDLANTKNHNEYLKKVGTVYARN